MLGIARGADGAAIDVERVHRQAAIPAKGVVGQVVDRRPTVDGEHTANRAGATTHTQQQGAAIDGGAAAVGVVGTEGEVAAVGLEQRATTADHTRDQLVGGAVDHQGAGVADGAGVGATAQGAAAANRQGAGVDRGAAAVKVAAGEREGAGASLNEGAGGARRRTTDGEIAGRIADVDGAADARTQREAAVDRGAGTRVAQGAAIEHQVGGGIARGADVAVGSAVGQGCHRQGAFADGGGTGVGVGTAEGEHAVAGFLETAAAADHTAQGGVVGDDKHPAVARQGNVAAQGDRCRGGPTGVNGECAELGAVGFPPTQTGDVEVVGERDALGDVQLTAIEDRHQRRVVAQVGLGLHRQPRLVDDDASRTCGHRVGAAVGVLADAIGPGALHAEGAITSQVVADRDRGHPLGIAAVVAQL